MSLCVLPVVAHLVARNVKSCDASRHLSMGTNPRFTTAEGAPLCYIT
jgi:hypothetical protein